MHLFVRMFLLLFLLLVAAVTLLRYTERNIQVLAPAWMLPHHQEEDVWARLEGPLAADDPRVLKILKDNFLEPPSALPYNLSGQARQKDGRKFSWPWIFEHVEKLFGEQRGGFFVEAGALDGEYLSNTLWLERRLGWTGLLVEPDRESYKTLISKHRKAWTSNTCLSAESFPKKTILVSRRPDKGRFVAGKGFSWAYRSQTHELGIDYPNKVLLETTTDKWYSKVQCFPLLSFLLALNVTTVDLLTLDVQGTEMPILRHFLSSTRIAVRVMVVEDAFGTFNHSFMASHGYVLVGSDLDHVYVKGDDAALNRSGVTTKTTPQ